MKRVLWILIAGLCLASADYPVLAKDTVRKKILVVDSYHKGYNWSKDTGDGFNAAMLDFGYFDNRDQTVTFDRDDHVETSKAIIKKLWMDTKRKSSKAEQIAATVEFTEIAKEFRPGLIFLGDDNAAQYIGNQFLDADIPLVFWGVNNTPVKYGLVDSVERPGHNVTGVYQSGYYVDGLKLLKSISPDVKTFAVLADDSTTGRSMVKQLQHFSRKGVLPVTLTDVVSVPNFNEWKKRILELQKHVDAFFIAQYNALKDEKGDYVPNTEVAKWYLVNVKIPEAAIAGQFVKQGMLCTANDGGYNQGYDAVVMAHDILANGADPALLSPRAPRRGALIVNRQRAEMLGITLTEDMGIEEYVDEASALNMTAHDKGSRK